MQSSLASALRNFFRMMWYYESLNECLDLTKLYLQMKEASQKTCDVFKFCLAVGITVTFLCDFPSTQAATDGESGNEEKGSGTHQKLLIIMLDG